MKTACGQRHSSASTIPSIWDARHISRQISRLHTASVGSLMTAHCRHKAQPSMHNPTNLIRKTQKLMTSILPSRIRGNRASPILHGNKATFPTSQPPHLVHLHIVCISWRSLRQKLAIAFSLPLWHALFRLPQRPSEALAMLLICAHLNRRSPYLHCSSILFKWLFYDG